MSPQSINQNFKSLFANQKPNKSKRYRNWYITLVYKKDAVKLNEIIQSMIKSLAGYTYYIYQLERGGKTKKLHHHLFIRYSQPKSYNQIGKAFYGAHIQHISGPVQNVINYCSKEVTRVKDPVEWGELVKQGKRNDLIEIQEMINNDWTNDQISEIYPVQTFLYHQNINVMRERYVSKKLAGEFRHLKVTYIFGKTGTGKTKYIYDNYDALDIYRVTNYHHPFDGYDGQDVIVFDEFRSQIVLADMLNYLDGYFTRLPARYHDKTAAYTKVYIISNEPFAKMYPNVIYDNYETYQAFCRRIHMIKEYTINENDEVVIKEFNGPIDYYEQSEDPDVYYIYWHIKDKEREGNQKEPKDLEIEDFLY